MKCTARPADVKTPENPPHDYDWRKEPWFRDVSDISNFISIHLSVALAAEGLNGDAQEDEDCRIYMLLRPDITEGVFKSGAADESVRFRQAHAIAMAIDMITTAWAEKRKDAHP